MKELTLTFVILAAFGAQAFGQGPEPPRISTSGSAEVSVPAYKARFTIRAVATADNARDAGLKVATMLNAVRDAMVKAGLDRDSLPSAGYSVGLERADGTRQPKAYTASSSVRIDITNLEQLGSVVDTALSAGATEVFGVEFLPRDADTARGQALELAFAHARRDAEALARAAGGRLGALISVSNLGEAQGGALYGVSGLTGGARATAIPPPEVQVSASVQTQWRFETASGVGQ